jgi:glycosyltransferase involved in cell wall biosynthesis
MRILLIGTHPSQTTGYSRVVYNIAKQLENYPDIHLTIFGIQKFTDVNDNIRLDLPSNVNVWDVYSSDKDDFGFGSNSLAQFVIINNPDIVMIYNDSEVIKKYIMNLEIARKNQIAKNINLNFKIVAYLDQVHAFHDTETIKYIANNTSHVFCFTDYWKQNYLSYFTNDERNTIEKKCSIIRHGIELNTEKYLENVSEHKKRFGFPQDSFIFVNLNRYANKKRLDICIQAFVKFLKKTGSRNSYLYFPAVIDRNYKNLLRIWTYELEKNNINNYSQFVCHDKHLSDEDINCIYAMSDVGLNTCDGEGFGLCNYEHASFGRPQILSKVGGLMDYFNEENSLLCVPKVVTYNVDMERGEVVDPEEVADKMLKYYTAKSLYNKHANKVKEIPNKYKWREEIGKMIDVLKKF